MSTTKQKLLQVCTAYYSGKKNMCHKVNCITFHGKRLMLFMDDKMRKVLSKKIYFLMQARKVECQIFCSYIAGI